MSINIVDLVTKQIGGNALSGLASLIGQDTDRTRSAVGAAVPALLAGLSSIASKPEGSRQLLSALGSPTVSNVLSNLGGQVTGQGAKSLSEAGLPLLGSLFGNNMVSGLLGGLARFTGMGEGVLKMLLGWLTPVVLGVLGQQQKTTGLDASGLSGFLAGQKDNILGAMPAGLSSVLGSIPGFGDLFGSARAAAGAAVGAAADTARATAVGATQAAHTAVRTAEQAGSSAMRWLIPLILLGALGLILWQCRRAPETTAPTVTDTAPVRDVTTDAAAQLTRATSDLRGAFSSATEALSGITDAATADAAVPKLRDLSAQLDSFKPTWDGLPATARSNAVTTLKPLLESLSARITQVLNIPGVSDRIKPILDEIAAKFRAMVG